MRVAGSDFRVQETITTLRMSAKERPEYFSLSTAICQRVKLMVRWKQESVIGDGPAGMWKVLNGQRSLKGER